MDIKKVQVTVLSLLCFLVDSSDEITPIRGKDLIRGWRERET